MAKTIEIQLLKNGGDLKLIDDLDSFLTQSDYKKSQESTAAGNSLFLTYESDDEQEEGLDNLAVDLSFQFRNLDVEATEETLYIKDR